MKGISSTESHSLFGDPSPAQSNFLVPVLIVSSISSRERAQKHGVSPSGVSNSALSNLPGQPLLNYASSSVSLNTLLCTAAPKQNASTHTRRPCVLQWEKLVPATELQTVHGPMANTHTTHRPTHTSGFFSSSAPPPPQTALKMQTGVKF